MGDSAKDKQVRLHPESRAPVWAGAKHAVVCLIPPLKGLPRLFAWRCWLTGQSGAQSKKPRLMRGSERLSTRLSELEGLVLAG